MSLSTHKVEIVPVKLEKHENADSLSVVRVFGYSCVCRTEDWQGIELAAYLSPDSVVDVTRPEFTFLDKGDGKPVRIRAKRLRGVQSYGLLIPAPEGFKIGDDVAEHFGVTHYEPPVEYSHGEDVSGPYTHAYDIDSFQRFALEVFEKEEPVVLTEKIHGANAKFCYRDGQIFCGSKNGWKKESESNLWWQALKNTPELETFITNNPDTIVFGEVYGKIQNLKYGSDTIRFAAFDILKNGEWLDYDDARALAPNIPWVPEIARMNFDFDEAIKLASGPSLVPSANHFREGCVINPIKERYHLTIGRVKLKIVSPEYLEKS